MLVQEADFAVFLDIPRIRENVTDNSNKRYVWSDVETKVFLDVIHRTEPQFKMENRNGMPPCLVSDLQPLLLLFITAMCNIAYSATH